MDYQGNSKKTKNPAVPEKKKVEKVIVGEVVIKKKSLGQKIKDVFIEADFRSVTRYVISDVLIPAARNMIVDASHKGVERMIYGEQGYQRRDRYGMGRTTYGGSPLQRMDYRHPSTRPPSPVGPSFYPRAGKNDFILETKEEATNVLQSMHDILEMYEEVSVADLHELMGVPTSHTDQKWGWTNLLDSHVRQVRDGYVIELPPVETI